MNKMFTQDPGLPLSFLRRRESITPVDGLVPIVGNYHRHPNIGKTPVIQVDQLKLVNLFNAVTNA